MNPREDPNSPGQSRATSDELMSTSIVLNIYHEGLRLDSLLTKFTIMLLHHA